MYSYQHRYHAGNFADLHKHISLIAILQYLHKKTAPFFVLDAFAGEGQYNLKSVEAAKNKEYLTGMKLLNQNIEYPLFNRFSSLVEKDIYPGSPKVIASQLRAQDRAAFIEGHPVAYSLLVDNFNVNKNNNLKIYKQDAYQAVKSLVPYKEPRGVIFLDPSYEVKEEYKNIAQLVLDSYKKNATGIYIIWYPLLVGKNYHNELIKILCSLEIQSEKIWHHVFKPFKSKNQPDYGLYGSGLVVINMPWSVDHEIEACFNELELL